MKILHLIQGEEKFNDVINMYNESFNNGEHSVCYLKKDSDATCIKENIAIPQYEISFRHNIINRIIGSFKLISLINDFDYVVMHSFCIDKIVTLYLYLKKKFTNKHMVWIEWGADLYDFQLKDKPSLKNKISFHVGQEVRNNVNTFIGIFPPDCDYYKAHYPKSKAKIYAARYLGGRGDHLYNYDYADDCRLRQTLKNNETIYIQVGHNGQEQLKHIAALEYLRKYADEDIMLFLPLSYSGTEEYINKIREYLERYFKGKYIILDTFMPVDDYFKLLDRVDIAIFNTVRQTGLGNVQRMIRKNVKLFMPENSTMFNYFNSWGIPIHSVESIKNMTFSKFIEVTDWNNTLGPKKYIEYLSDYDGLLDEWRLIFKDLKRNV